MSTKPIHIFVGVLVGAAAVSLALQDWAGLFGLPSDVLVGYLVLIVLALVSEGTALRLRVGRGTTTRSSISFLPLIACVLLFGTTPTVLFFAISGVVSQFFIPRRELIKSTFNVSQYIVSAALAGIVFDALGGEPLAILSAQEAIPEFDAQLIPFAGFGITFLALNNSLVFLAISLSSSLEGPRHFVELLQRHSSPFFNDLLISPLAILIAFLYFELGVLGLAVSLLPLLFVRHSYLSKHLYEEANRDLLRALVKAIETRDPYTSGHSVRVQELAQRIGKALGLKAKHLDELGTAALLHDIGKIEVVYEEILRKPGALSSREREIIQSHVTRGVEILSSLSSFPNTIVSAVRHHHEAFDGSGYPDGLKGKNIPLYARIIQTCDAIDAMLSDRPYRRALGVEAVEEELRKCRGVQFDEALVECVLAHGLVKRHKSEMRRERNERRGVSYGEEGALLLNSLRNTVA